jgi:hypothetical protein
MEDLDTLATTALEAEKIEDLEIQICSDVHLEFDKHADKFTIEAKAPYLALLGDIGRPHKDTYFNLLNRVSSDFDEVFVIAGNHEYYNEGSVKRHSYNHRTIRNQKDSINDICREIPNVHFLDNAVFITKEGWRIMGGTLWTGIPWQYRDAVSLGMNDYTHIYQERDVPLTTGRVCEMHAETVKFFEAELKKDGKTPTLVLTHHVPVMDQMSGVIQDPIGATVSNPIKYAYGTDLTRLLKPPICGWAFGHTHTPCDYFVGEDVRLISNPRGYPSERLGTDPSRVFVFQFLESRPVEETVKFVNFTPDDCHTETSPTSP